MDQKIICFDVDCTVTPGISWDTLTRGLGASLPTHQRMYKDAQKGILEYREFENKLKNLYLKTGNAISYNIIQIFDSIKPFPEAHTLFTHLNRHGFHIYLVSSGAEIFVSCVAQKLPGVTGFYGNGKIEFGFNKEISQIHFIKNQGQEKVRALREIALKHGVSTKDIYFVGDGDNDIDAFKETGKGIAVHTKSLNLSMVAWKICEKLTDVQKLF